MVTALKAKRVKTETESAITPIPPMSAMADASAIERVYELAKAACDEITALEIVDYSSSDNANILIAKVKTGRKAVDELRKKILAEPKRFTDTVNSMFKPILDMCDTAVAAANKKRDAFREVELARQRADEEKAAKEAARRQKISISHGGDGSNIKPVAQPVNQLKERSTDVVRRIPDKEKMQSAIDEATKKIQIHCPLNIPGVLITCQWVFQITDASLVPDEYKKNSYVG